MSFILDALRKSESERQQDSKPSIARIPSAVPQHGLPRWAVATMAALGLGIVVLAGAWLSTLTGAPGTSADARSGGAIIDSDARYAAREDAPDRDSTADRASSRRVEPLELPPTPATPVTTAVDRSTGSLANPQANTARGSAPADSAQASPLAAAAQPSPLAMAARSASSTPRPSPAASRPTANRSPDRSAAALPDVSPTPEPYHAVAASLGLPELTLQLLAYDENDPSQQYAFINGSRYAAGDTLPDGARVIAINRRGAVLLVGGRQLQLEPR